MTLKEGHESRDEAKAKDSRPEKMKRKVYESELEKLQVRLCKLQDWVKEKGLRVVIVFEDATPPERAGRSKPSPKRSVRAFFALPRSPLRPIAKKPRYICSATWSGFRPPAKSSSSIAAGTTEPASST